MKIRGFPCFRRQTLLHSFFFAHFSVFALISEKTFYVFLVFTETNLAKLEIYTEIAELYWSRLFFFLSTRKAEAPRPNSEYYFVF